MPEPITKEEDAFRQHSLCLFNFLGIDVKNRCTNCPGPVRSHLQHFRCPGAGAQPNRLNDAVDQVNLSASSSGKGKEPETDSLLVEVPKLSLADPSASGSCSATSSFPSQEDVVSKRKFEIYQMQILGLEFQKLSVQDWTIDKPPIPFGESPDAYPNNRQLHQMMQNSEPEMMQISEPQVMQNPEPQMMQILEPQMMQNLEPQMMQLNLEPQMMQNSEENHSAGRASTSTTTAFIPGFYMYNDVPGVYPCCSALEIEEPK